MSRVQSITRALKRFDRELFAEETLVRRRRKDYDEAIHSDPWVYVKQVQVKRKITRLEGCWLDDETRLFATKEMGDIVFSLTDNWSITGEPVDWGIEVIMARIKACDMWNRGFANIIEEMDKEALKADESKERSRHNTVESFLYDFRDAFKESTKHINTANMRDPRWDKQKTRSY
jgi:hypothetical protein